jgi:hypothetical protein
MFRFRDANGQIHQLTAAELALKGKLLENNRAVARPGHPDREGEVRRADRGDHVQPAAGIVVRSPAPGAERLPEVRSTGSASSTSSRSTRSRSRTSSRRTRPPRSRARTISTSMQLQLLDQQHELQTRMLRAQNNVDASNSS